MLILKNKMRANGNFSNQQKSTFHKQEKKQQIEFKKCCLKPGMIILSLTHIPPNNATGLSIATFCPAYMAKLMVHPQFYVILLMLNFEPCLNLWPFSVYKSGYNYQNLTYVFW